MTAATRERRIREANARRRFRSRHSDCSGHECGQSGLCQTLHDRRVHESVDVSVRVALIGIRVREIPHFRSAFDLCGVGVVVLRGLHDLVARVVLQILLDIQLVPVALAPTNRLIGENQRRGGVVESGLRARVRIRQGGVRARISVRHGGVGARVRIRQVSVSARIRVRQCRVRARVRVRQGVVGARVRVRQRGVSASNRVVV